MRDLSRRRMLALLAASAASAPLTALGQSFRFAPGVDQPSPFSLRRNPNPSFDWPAAARVLRRQHADLARHFAFEYYPWYGTSPWRHWDQWERRPPADIAATSLPRLGPYSSIDPAVVERHARWIAESGIGAINVSWWGRGSYEDRAVPLLMDVMRDHGIKVAFHLEPYTNGRARAYADDVLYLVREYGEKRRWDALLILEDADGREGPVFKSFATILPFEVTDCHGRTTEVPLWAPVSVWREQTDTVRETLRRDFDHIRLLADSSDFSRIGPSGFDGIALYDNYVRPASWPGLAEACRAHDLLFSFNINAGFDAVEPRTIDPEGCYSPLPFEPPADVDWRTLRGRDRARQTALARISESARTTVGLQIDPALPDMRRGFFLVYINSFNEWHEGTAFEPMKDYRELTPAERDLYHNPLDGDYRLDALTELLRPLLG
jgi:hypothetical protein